MKKILLATIALSLVATPAAFAHSYKGQSYKGHGFDKHYSKHKKSRWSKGQRLDRNHRRHVIHQRDYRRYHLRQPPRGYSWVRVDNDFLLVATATGIISSIIGAAIANSY